MKLLPSKPGRWARTQSLFKNTFNQWLEDKAPKLAASLAFYTMLALAPLLVLVTGILGLAFGEEAAKGEVVAQIDQLIGRQGAQAVQSMIVNASQSGTGLGATILGTVMVLIGATIVFVELQDSMNTVWDVKPKTSGIKGLIKGRIASFTMILGIGFLLMVSLILSAVISAMAAYMNELLPGMGWIWQLVNFAVSFAIITGLFAMIFKVLPDVQISWREVWFGAAVTALLFSIGKTLIGLYLGQSTAVSVHGAAGSLVVILLWVYYAAQILFFGAEFTQVHARMNGHGIVPSENAVRIGEKDQSPAPAVAK